jgi:hypothetical protein
MSINCRFALDEKRNVIDAVNVANSGKAYCHEGDPEDDKYLRERVLIIRLSGMIEKLIIICSLARSCHRAQNISLQTKSLTQSGW